jgi:hypothetical protein
MIVVGMKTLRKVKSHHFGSCSCLLCVCYGIYFRLQGVPEPVTHADDCRCGR